MLKGSITEHKQQEGSDMADEQETKLQRQRTAEIVAAYVKHNNLSVDQLGTLIATVHSALAGRSVEPEPERSPAVPIRQSVRPDYVVCLDCGWRGKMLGRHIAAQHQLTRTEYRVRWGLPPEHPLVAPAYSERRSEYAKQTGLGRRPQAEAETNGSGTEGAPPKALQRRKRELPPGGAEARPRLQADPPPPVASPKI